MTRAPAGDDRPEVSVIIPVLDQETELLTCLNALHCQTYSRNRFEVIVVDNGSRHPLQEVTDSFSFVRLVSEPKAGSYAARNRGVEAARADILAFTDADCVPAEDWIEQGVRAIHELAGPGMIGGEIALTFHDPVRPSAAELYDVVFGFLQKDYVRWGFSATANMFTTRATVAAIGPFDERLMSSGDMDWGQRVRWGGLAQQYAPDVRVLHPARRTLGQLLRKVVRVAGGNQQLAEQRNEGTFGLSEYAWRQVVCLRRLRGALSDERLCSLSRKVRFGAVVWLVDVVRTVERYRVHYGGTPRRL